MTVFECSCDNLTAGDTDNNTKCCTSKAARLWLQIFRQSFESSESAEPDEPEHLQEWHGRRGRQRNRSAAAATRILIALASIDSLGSCDVEVIHSLAYLVCACCDNLRQGRYVFTCVCLSVCMSVCLLTGLLKKLLIRSLWNLVEWFDIIRRPVD